ncbi:MAG: hypothetical protein ACKV22_18585 [Bryobacteraceae bacterium]
MPGKRWNLREKRLLRRQIRDGILPADMVVPERTAAGIVYELRQLRLYPTSRWTKAEVGVLRREAKAANPPWKINVVGRSPFAVRNKMLRMDLWKPKSHKQEPWMRSGLNRLKHLVVDCGYTARRAVTNGYFPGRSVHSVAQQMRRNYWKRTTPSPGV